MTRRFPPERKTAATRRPRRSRRAPSKGGETVPLYGLHAVAAALANPLRRPLCLHATHRALALLAQRVEIPAGLPVDPVKGEALRALAPPGAVTQGLLLEAAPLAPRGLEEAAPVPGARSFIVVLDQVTDPMNVGAILRSAAAFGAGALVTQDRHSPPESGALARAASGALDLVPWIRVSNLARALDRLADLGYWRIGLAAGDHPALARRVTDDGAIALVLGAEGRGLRPLTEAHCDELAAIPITPAHPLIDSLNVSNAAAIALYELTRRGGP
ncbi:MAG: RNA methyltransferase [Alphaproteobacteria bacterium]|nr:MAG: RNA methyltransferase [Alphaproteobacteria bacterium]